MGAPQNKLIGGHILGDTGLGTHYNVVPYLNVIHQSYLARQDDILPQLRAP